VLALWALATTVASLRLWSFDRNILCSPRAKRGEPDAAGVLIPAFLIAARLSPRHLDCLPSALALRRYLGWRGVRTDFVIGVKIAPFAAHCWLQIEDVVVGDSLERVRGFTPIRIVR
jgi:hypothetical protein